MTRTQKAQSTRIAKLATVGYELAEEAIAPGGTILEINHSGQYLWIERLAGLADLLANTCSAWGSATLAVFQFRSGCPPAGSNRQPSD